jgi:integrase
MAHKAKQGYTAMNTKNAQQMHNTTGSNIAEGSPTPGISGGKGGLPRTDLRYWQKRVEKPAPRPGYESPFYSVQIAFGGRRVRFPLSTPNKAAAAAKAQNIYLSLMAVGWEQTLAKFKPGVAKPAHIASVGELIEAVGANVAFRKSTFDGYCTALRVIVSHIANIGDQVLTQSNGRHLKDKDGKPVYQSRFDYHKGGRAAWLQKVHAVPLSILTPERIQRWRLEYLKKAGDAPDARKRATNSLNSHLRNARSLFSEKALQFVRDRLSLPDPLPFAGIKLDSKPPSRYISRIDAPTILRAAMEELAPNKARTEQFKILCLCLLCGLRKREADSLLWRQVDFSKKCITIETTEYFQPKSEDSHAAIDLDDHLLGLLQQWHDQAQGEFVIDSKNPPRYKSHRTNYRCQRDFESLNVWLKSHGVHARKPVHELRKELGAIIANEHGIFAAQNVLRHSDIRITSQYYADKKVPITSSLGGVLSTTINGQTGQCTPRKVQGPVSKRSASRAK